MTVRPRDLLIVIAVLVGLRLIGVRVSIPGSLAVTLVVWGVLFAVERRSRG